MRSPSRAAVAAANLVRSARLPDKHTPLAPEPEPEAARRGQILVMFALFSMALFGVLGLATDVGVAMAARRSVQGAADAGAIAGTRMIANYTSANPTSALNEVNTIVKDNTFGQKVPSVNLCEYIGDNWGTVGTCNQTIPSSASGTRVRTKLTIDTFFIRVLPGAPKTVTVTGYAKARMMKVAPEAGNGPFIVCGRGTKLASGGTTNILKSDGTIDPAAYNKTYLIHGPQIPDCQMKSNSFKGLADQSANAGKGIGDWWDGDNGTKAGPTRVKVRGVQGCDVNTPSPYNCVMILPIATDNPAAKKQGSVPKFYIVQLAAFLVTETGANTHTGKLLENYIVTGPGSTSPCGGRDCGGSLVTIKLIW